MATRSSISAPIHKSTDGREKGAGEICTNDDHVMMKTFKCMTDEDADEWDWSVTL